MRNINKRQPRKFGGGSYAWVAQGYPSTINNKAKKLSTQGYLYRIITVGRQRILYIGPKRRIRRGGKKTKKLKKTNKGKKK